MEKIMIKVESKGFDLNYKILIILICIYVLRMYHVYESSILKELCKLLDITEKTIIKYVKKNTIKDIISIYKN